MLFLLLIACAAACFQAGLDTATKKAPGQGAEVFRGEAGDREDQTIILENAKETLNKPTAVECRIF